MWWAIVAIFGCALVAPLLHRASADRAHWVLAAVPLVVFVWFGTAIPALPTGPPTREVIEWVPSLGLRIALHLDGLSLLFALLITGLGTLIVVYAGEYGVAAERRASFHATLFVFMGAMLGLVLADDALLLFVFWELTSITSYLLIATAHEDPRAVRNARQALFITSGGSLALLAGLLVLCDASGQTELSAIVAQGRSLVDDERYSWILGLVVLGAFTKSAIVPFHLWLPNAMSAPTPVSAYLHSATMVKAGVYLLARLRPALGGTDAWLLILGFAGAATILLASTRVLRQTDIKSVLAETTVIALGALVMMLAMPEPHASSAAIVFLVVHALYKASAFMLAGIVGKRAGTRDLRQLGGLRRAMPRTAAIATVVAIAMMGLPPMFGFIGKELIYETTIGTDRLAPLWTLAAFAGNTMTVSGALLVFHHVFFGPVEEGMRADAADPSLAMLAGPAVLATAGVAFGVFHTWAATQLVAEAVRAIDGPQAPVELRLWHGFGWALALSTVTVVVGVTLYSRRAHVLELGARFPRLFEPRADRVYDLALTALARTAATVTRTIQSGRLRQYVLVLVLCAALAPALALGSAPLPALGGAARGGPAFSGVEPLALAAIALIAVAALLACTSRGRIASMVCVMVVGYGIALVFVIAGAPDVAFTQFTVETLLVILVSFALSNLRAAPVAARALVVGVRDAAAGAALGTVVAVVLLAVLAEPLDLSAPAYFLAQSVPRAHGRNVVNAILVDFRALDTLGEIAVLGAAALGVTSLLRREVRA